MRRIIISILFALSSFYGNCQDIAFSQFIYNPIFLNPAACGIERGLRASINYHRDLSLSSSKFETLGLSFDQSLHDLDMKGLGGTGLFLLKTQEGDGRLNT